MDVYFYFAVVFASQDKVDVNVQEAGLDLVLVMFPFFDVNVKEWLRHSKLSMNCPGQTSDIVRARGKA